MDKEESVSVFLCAPGYKQSLGTHPEFLISLNIVRGGKKTQKPTFLLFSYGLFQTESLWIGLHLSRTDNS